MAKDRSNLDVYNKSANKPNQESTALSKPSRNRTQTKTNPKNQTRNTKNENISFPKHKISP
jgi:hypothetical protein